MKSPAATGWGISPSIRCPETSTWRREPCSPRDRRMSSRSPPPTTETPAATGEATATIQVKRLDEGLHAWWKLDESSGTTARDSSGNLRDASLTGGGTWIMRDDANPALELNGTDARLSRYDFESLAGGTPFTVAAWVRVPVTHDSEGVLFHQSTGVINGRTGVSGVT